MLLLTPTFLLIKKNYPDAVIDVIVRKGTEGILCGCSVIRNVLLEAAPEKRKRTRTDIFNSIKLVGKLRKEKYDYAFDMSGGDRSRTLVALSGAKNKVTNIFWPKLSWYLNIFFNHILNFNYTNLHQVEKDLAIVKKMIKLKGETPRLVFEKSATIPCLENEIQTDFIVMHISTRWKRKQWPLERWINVGKHLLKFSSQIIISVGPDPIEIEFGDQLKKYLGEKSISTEGKLSFSQVAWLLYKTQLFVGVDTAIMHLAAACHTPIVALFGPTNEHQWAPWKSNTHLVLAKRDGAEKLANGFYEPSQIPMDRIPVSDVINACNEILKL